MGGGPNPKPKKTDVMAALREPSENLLTSHRIQEQRKEQATILGSDVVIKEESKTQIKINTRHKYKNINYDETLMQWWI